MSESVDAETEVRLLEFRARITGPSSVLRGLSAIFPTAPAWTTQTAGPVAVSVRASPSATDPSRGQIFCDDVLCGETDGSTELLAGLTWAITARAIEYLGNHHLLFHAGVAAFQNRGVLFPAAGGSGKTTLVASLLRRGFQYLGDDIAVIDRTTLECLPFAGSLSLKGEARDLLAPLYPELATAAYRVHFRGQEVTYLPPPRRAWPEQPMPIDFVILPAYLPGTPTNLAPISRVQALRGLLEQSFNARRLGGLALVKTSELVRGAECYALTFDDAQAASDLVKELVS